MELVSCRKQTGFAFTRLVDRVVRIHGDAN